MSMGRHMRLSSPFSLIVSVGKARRVHERHVSARRDETNAPPNDQVINCMVLGTSTGNPDGVRPWALKDPVYALSVRSAHMTVENMYGPRLA